MRTDTSENRASAGDGDRPRHRSTLGYIVFGVLFGCAFPLVATILDTVLQELPLTLESFRSVQARQPLHWVIDSAPLFLGILAAMAGRRKDVIHALNAQIEASLRREIELDRLVSEVTRELITLRPDEVDTGIQDVLGRIGRFVDADRCHFYVPADHCEVLEARFSWHAPGVEPRPEELLRVTNWRNLDPAARLSLGEVVQFDRLSDAGADAPLLEAGDIRSMVCVPVLSGGSFRGAIGFDAVRAERAWGPEIVALLRSVGDMVVAALDRARTARQVRLQATALESAANAIVITDVDGRIEWANPAFTALTGWERDEAIGRTPSLLKSGRHDGEFYARMWDEICRGDIWRGEVENRRRDGSLYFEEMTIAPVKDEAGTVAAFVAIKQDITQRKRSERELQQAEEAARVASRQKSEFLANMSHEIRTPLNGVIGMTELVLDTGLTTEQRESLTTVKSSADALLTILNDILDFSKIEAGRLDLESIPFALQDCVRQAVRPLATLAEKKGLELLLHVADDVPDSVIGDPGRLRQVLLNLVGNAIKFTEHGEVVVRVRQQSVDETETTVLFEVVDTGIGIALDKLESIFEKFTQADGSMTRRFGGTGLGLAISRSLVGMMQGELGADSEPGVGSTFRFTIGLKIHDDASEAAAPLHGANLKGTEVLIVDDNATNRRILRYNLESWGAKPVDTESGRKALELLGRAHDGGRPFDLVVLDAQMPEMDGFMLAETIRGDERFRDLRLLMLTSAGRRGDGARCREIGIEVYLIKPVVSLDLHQAIRTVMGWESGEKPAELLTQHSLRERSASLRVLLAEDNAVNRTVATRLVENLGHRVEAVGSGTAVLELLARQPFDVILMDLQMPEMDGLQATRRIRERERESGSEAIPIIALTAHAMSRDRQRCLDAGMDAFITKPIDRTELARLLGELADRQPVAVV